MKLGIKKSETRNNKSNTIHTGPLLSVIVPVRNEAKRIGPLLRTLKTQSIPNSHFEIIFIDDQSTDNTVELINNFSGVNSDLNAKLIQISSTSTGGKKKAINLGVSMAKGEYIVQTDGDVKANSEWLSNIFNFVSESPVDLLILPVFIEKENSYTSSFDSMEYASLQAIGLGMSARGFPIICSASNLAFKKSFYENVKSNRSDEDISSGDDIFLLQKAISGNFKIEHLINEDVLVTSPSLNNYKEFIEQRKRWVSKNTSIKDPVYQSVAILGFVTNVIILISIISKPSFGGSLILIKLISDFLLFKRYYSLINQPFSQVSFLINSIIYPFYLIYIVLISYSTKNSWKGRIVQS